MKNLKMLMLLLVVGCMAACNDKDSDEEKVDEPIVATYVGTIMVDQNDGTTYEQKDVNLTIKIEEGTADIDMSQVSFSEAMPVRIDMTVPNITATKTSSGYALSGNDIIPMAMGGEFRQVMIKNITGNTTSEILDFDMSLDINIGTLQGLMSLTFSGTKKI